MTNAVYTTVDGDRLDLICTSRYGSPTGAVEFVLEKNPHLKDKGVYLEAGIDIELPDLPKAGSDNLFDPWNL